MKDTKIRCRNGKEAHTVLQLIQDRYPEVRWNSGDKPAGWEPALSDCKENGCAFTILRNRLSYDTAEYVERNPMDFTDATSAKRFLRSHKTAIHIYQSGRKVIAHESNTGREGVAICCPTDEFNFGVGARIALLRLLGEEVPSSLTGRHPIEIKKEELKVGDRVVIREWDDMAQEFGVNAFGSIKCNNFFTERMKKYCGKVARIIATFTSTDSFKLEFEDGKETPLYAFSTEMFRKVGDDFKAPKFSIGDKVEVRQWDEMADEFGTDKYGDIGEIAFVSTMSRFCGKAAIVRGKVSTYYYLLSFEGNENCMLSFSESALKPYGEIKVGDSVEIINSGKCYTTYPKWVAQNIEDKEAIAKYAYGFTPKVGTRGEVLKIAEHGEFNDGLLAYIKDDTSEKCYLIGIKGVEKIES